MDRNKIRSGDKIQNGGDRKFWGLTSCLVINPLQLEYLALFAVLLLLSARPRVNNLCQIMERLLFFRISTEPPKRLLDHSSFGHTHHWSYS